MGLGHAHARRRQARLRSLPPRLAARLLPRRHRAEGGRRRRRRGPARRLPVARPEGRTARAGRTPGSTARRVWTSQQLDEIVAAGRARVVAGPHGATDWDDVRAAADYIVANGPAHRPGALGEPGRLVAEHDRDRDRGAVCAADDRARERRPPARAASYEATADEWQAKVECWTATTNGPYSPRPYYLRVTKDGNPDDGTMYTLGDNFPRQVDQREIVDNSFLGPRAVRRQAPRRPDDRSTRSRSATRRARAVTDTPNGQFWHRFTFDGYGETGRRRRLGPVLRQPARADARARVAAARRRARRVRADRRPATRARSCGRSPSTANDGLMLPEQVWDGRPPTPATSQRRGHALGDAAGLDARAVHPARVVDPGRRADRAPAHRRLPLHRPGLLSGRRSSRLSRSARRTRHRRGAAGSLN